MSARFTNVQVLRAVAALIVVLSHAAADVARATGDAPRVFLAGEFGVEIFFVISGFIICHTNFDRFGALGARTSFIWSRIWRVVPLYWACTALYLSIAILKPRILNGATLEISHLIGSFFFIPVSNPGGGTSPFYQLGWSLNYEMFFYAIFTIGLSFQRKYSVPGIIVLLIALTLLHPLASPGTPMEVWTGPHLLEFLTGISLALFVRRVEWRVPGGLFWPALIVLITISASLLPREGKYLLSVNSIVLSTAIVALGVFTRPADIFGLGAVVGDASYSLYLTHMFVVRAAIMVAPPMPYWLMIGLVTIGATLAAIVSYRLFEQPTLNFSRSIWRRFNEPRVATPGPTSES